MRHLHQPMTGEFASSLALVLVLTTGAACAGGSIDFDAEGWELSGDAAVTTREGTTALTVGTGRAAFAGIELTDGTIEVDVEVTEHRSFVYVAFRVEERGEHEEIYLRPHNSSLPDAIQYTPAYRGRAQWQLYHDARSTAAARLPAGEPIHLKIVLQGGLGAVWVGDADAPQLLFHCARSPKAGHIALSAFRPAGVPDDLPMARFTNLSVRPGEIDPGYSFPLFETFVPPPGRIDRWLLSPAFAPAEGPVRELPADLGGPAGWKPVGVTLLGGFVEIERAVERPEGVRRAAVLARLRITAEEAATRRLDLGFSDEVSVFLNGRLLVSADDSYSFNEPRRQGLLTNDQLAVYLPLEKGENDLTLAIADRFGGWGLSGRIEDRTGLTIAPR